LEASPSVITDQRGVVISASAAWFLLCRFQEHEVIGRTLTCIQGPGTDRVVLKKLMEEVQKEQPVKVTLVNYTKDRQPFRHTVQVTPVWNAEGILFSATSHDVAWLNPYCPNIYCNAIDVDDSILGELDMGALSIEPWRRESGIVQLLPRPAVPCQLPSWLGEGADGNATMVVVTHVAAPYVVLWASPAWLQVCGFAPDEIVGRSLQCIQGPATDVSQLMRLTEAARAHIAIENIELINYSKQRQPFRHLLSVRPIFPEHQDEVDEGSAPPVMLCAVSKEVRSLACGQTRVEACGTGTDGLMHEAAMCDERSACQPAHPS